MNGFDDLKSLLFLVVLLKTKRELTTLKIWRLGFHVSNPLGLGLLP